ncbi:RNA polymerase sigma factor [Parafilimonas sp.]|uniref:RNA polymerase sigma factor n=1 Tax=Parafilimonas sp. TaxID=1969739 RepID=UPI0039E66589
MNKNELKHISDQELLARFKQTNDNRLLGILLQRYTLLLLGVCMKHLKNEEVAKDAVQQIFLKVIHELQRYPVQYFKSWLYMVARNYCLMQLRKHEEKNIADFKDNIADEEFPLQREIEKQKMISLLETSLQELNDDQKTCITFFYLEKKSYQQISAQTGFSLMQVKSYIQNGKRNLKLLVERKLRDKQ